MTTALHRAEVGRRYYMKHRKAGLCVSCTEPAVQGVLCLFHAKKQNKRQKKINRDVRQQVLDHYGAACAWPDCGITDPDMLSLDHKENDGAKERREIGRGNTFYRFVIKSGYPDKYQILCMNHQVKKRYMLLRDEPIPSTKRAVVVEKKSFKYVRFQ